MKVIVYRKGRKFTKFKITDPDFAMSIEEHIKERDISAYIDDLWNSVVIKLKSKGITPATIHKAVKASRKKQG